MMIAVIIVACAIANAMQCETIPTGISVGSESACGMAGQMWAAQRLDLNWELRDIKCKAAFVDENNG